MKTTLFGCALAGAVLFSMAACRNEPSADCATAEQSLRQEISQKDSTIQALRDSLDKYASSKANAGTYLPADTTAMGNVTEAGKPMYKKGRSRREAISAEWRSRYPGEFPEGSARLLTVRDLEFLSPWGLKVMKNEIYARHGMIFTDPELKEHFGREKWYHGTSRSLNSQLSKTERTNIEFIDNYKYDPNIPA